MRTPENKMKRIGKSLLEKKTDMFEQRCQSNTKQIFKSKHKQSLNVNLMINPTHDRMVQLWLSC